MHTLAVVMARGRRIFHPLHPGNPVKLSCLPLPQRSHLVLLSTPPGKSCARTRGSMATSTVCRRLVSLRMSRPYRAKENWLVTFAWGFARRFTPGYHMIGFQPSHCGPSTCHAFD